MTFMLHAASSFSDHRRFIIAFVICCCAALTYFQTAGFPFVPFTDAICFLPQAVKFAQGEGMRNVYQFAYLPDGAYVWHGFLLPLVLGGLFGTDSYIKVTFVLAILNALNVLVLGAALFRMTASWQPSLRLVFIVFSLLTQVGFLQGVLGRPETLSSLLISCGLLTWSFNASSIGWAVLGVLTGLMAVTSPVPAVFSASLLGAAIIAREQQPVGVFKAGTIVGLSAIVSIAVAFWLYPYSLGQWIWGLQQHANAVIKDSIGQTTLALVLQRFVISSGRLFSGLVFVCCWAIALTHAWKTGRERPVAWLIVIAVLVLVGLAVLRMSFQGHFYYLLCLFPAAAGAVAVALHDQNLGGVVPKLGILVVLCLSSLDPLLLQAGRILGYTGLPLTEARTLFAEDLKEMPGQVAVSMDLALLSDTTERLQVLYDFVPPCQEPDTDWLVTQQYCFFFAEPPSYTNFRLVKNRFVAKSKLPGRLSQWFGVNGYGYAIYERLR